MREFVEHEVVPIANDLDRQEAQVPEHIIQKMAELGTSGSSFPPKKAGWAWTTSRWRLSPRSCRGAGSRSGSVMTRNLITGSLIHNNGTPEQKQSILPRIARGEVMTAAAFTEPDTGSDTASLKLRAVKHGDGYLLKGSKMWCTFANRANS